MRILALEFSSAQRSVALVEPGQTANTWVEHEAIETGAGTNAPFEMIEQVLRRASREREQVDALAIGVGPGSYNGIRAAIALAQGWQLARGVRLLAVSSAECVAVQAHSEGLRGSVAVVIDAQRGEFYLANYELTESGVREIKSLRLVSAEQVSQCQSENQLLIGPELDRWFPQGRVVWPRAVTLGKMAFNRSDFVPGEALQPIYLRQTTFVKAPPPRVLPP